MKSKPNTPTPCQWVEGLIGKMGSILNNCPTPATKTVTKHGHPFGHACARHAAEMKKQGCQCQPWPWNRPQ